MRDELRRRIAEMLQNYDVDIEWDILMNELVIILDDYQIKAAERSLVVLDECVNEKLLKKYLVAKAVEGCSKKTIAAYERQIKFFLSKIKKNVTDITTDDIRLYLAIRQTQDGITKSYADTELRYLRSFFKFLNIEGYIANNPTLKIAKIRAEKKKRKAFSEMEVEKLRGGCRNNRERAIIEVLLSTGCRVSELVDIKITDICDDTIVVRGKGDKERIVYLNAKALYALNQYINERKDNNAYLFAGGKFGVKSVCKYKDNWWKHTECVDDKSALSSGAVEDMVRRIGKENGVDNTHPHRFRRTCATWALSRGMPLISVSKMLGHENLATTEIYLDINQEELAAAHKKYVV